MKSIQEWVKLYTSFDPQIKSVTQLVTDVRVEALRHAAVIANAYSRCSGTEVAILLMEQADRVEKGEKAKCTPEHWPEHLARLKREVVEESKAKGKET